MNVAIFIQIFGHFPLELLYDTCVFHKKKSIPYTINLIYGSNTYYTLKVI